MTEKFNENIILQGNTTRIRTLDNVASNLKMTQFSREKSYLCFVGDINDVAAFSHKLTLNTSVHDLLLNKPYFYMQ